MSVQTGLSSSGTTVWTTNLLLSAERESAAICCVPAHSRVSVAAIDSFFLYSTGTTWSLSRFAQVDLQLINSTGIFNLANLQLVIQ